MMLKNAMAIVSVGLIGSAASAGEVYTFNAITSNGAGSVAIGEAQLAVEVIDAGAGSVEFLFTNAGPEDAVIAEIYWDDDAGFSLVYDAWSTTTPVIPGPEYGVDFGTPVNSPANPGNLPAGNTVSFTADFSLEPEDPQPKNGVGPGEDISVFFDYSGSFADLIAAMDSGELRVGLHVISFENGQSESFITGTGVPTPTAALAGVAMLGLAGLRRRRDA